MDNTGDSQSGKNNTEAGPPPTSPIASDNGSILGEPQTSGSNSKEEDASDTPRKTRTIEWLQFAANILLAVIGTIAICIYGGQLGVMKGQLTQMVNQFPLLQQASGSAKTSSDLAVQTMRLDQRGWLNFGLVQGQHLFPNQPIAAPILIGNSGKTPVSHVTGYIVAELLVPDQEPLFIYTKGHPRSHLPELTVLPNQQMHFSAVVLKYGTIKPQPVLYTDDIQKRVEGGHLLIVVHGSLTYDDVFRVHHWMHFCSYGAAGNLVGGPKGCNEWNQVDKNQ